MVQGQVLEAASPNYFVFWKKIRPGMNIAADQYLVEYMQVQSMCHEFRAPIASMKGYSIM
jgi:hypothetical protein